ncbi:MAG: hypothetical protein RLZZ387_771 [Chloroflexota bacterium]
MNTEMRPHAPVLLARLILVALLVVSLAACASTRAPTQAAPTASGPQPTASAGPAQLANPASVYCRDQGYTLELRTDPSGGQYGVCVLAPGVECEEWAFYRHECGPGAGATDAVTATTEITYRPAPSSAESRQGWCMSSSLAAWRPDAWRCMVDSEIYDPCFAVPGASESVICGADPTTGSAGFTLRLTQPLTAADVPQATTTHAWMLELADGTICGYATGATGGVGDKRINYLCQSADPSQRRAILGDLQAGTVWTAELAVITPGAAGPEVTESHTVSVRTLWR